VNSNPLPKHVVGSSGVNTMEVGSKERVLKVTMTRLYDMLLQSEHLEKSTKRCTGKVTFFHSIKKGIILMNVSSLIKGCKNADSRES
jgi:hypothetical protein